MKDLTNEIVELIRRTSSSLPRDVEDRLRAAVEKEAPGSAARGAILSWAKSWTLSRMASAVSPRSKLKGRGALASMARLRSMFWSCQNIL